jgi:hypothetical protein
MNTDYNIGETLITGTHPRKQRYLKTMVFAMTALALFACILVAESENQEIQKLFSEETFIKKVKKTDGTCRRIRTLTGYQFLIIDG